MPAGGRCSRPGLLLIAGTGLPATTLLESSLRDTGEPPGWRRSAADDCRMTDKPDQTSVTVPLRQEPPGGKLQHVGVAACAVIGGQELVADHE